MPSASASPAAEPASSSAENPAATDTCRRSPPATTATTRDGSQAADRIADTFAGAVTTTIRSISGTAARPLRVQARSGRPAIGATILSIPPIRVDPPAATTMASARGA